MHAVCTVSIYCNDDTIKFAVRFYEKENMKRTLLMMSEHDNCSGRKLESQFIEFEAQQRHIRVHTAGSSCRFRRGGGANRPTL